MRAIRAEAFGGYQDLKLVDIPSPALCDGRVLVRMTAAGVTPLDHTILFGQYPNAKAPLVLGNEGAGIVEGGGTGEYPTGSRVMLTGPYGVLENGTLSELVAVQKEHLYLVPDNVDDAAAAGLPVAYLTAFLTLKAAGFQARKTILAARWATPPHSWPERSERSTRFRRPLVTQRRNRPKNGAFQR